MYTTCRKKEPLNERILRELAAHPDISRRDLARFLGTPLLILNVHLNPLVNKDEVVIHRKNTIDVFAINDYSDEKLYADTEEEQ